MECVILFFIFQSLILSLFRLRNGVIDRYTVGYKSVW